MLSKNPKAYKRVSDRDLSAGGKGTRRSYHNYKKTSSYHMWDSSADLKHNTVLLLFADAIDHFAPAR
jgi:hypothetical protein